MAGGRIPSHPRPVQPSPQWDRELMAQYRAQLSGPSINSPPSAFRPVRLSTTSVEVESGSDFQPRAHRPDFLQDPLLPLFVSSRTAAGNVGACRSSRIEAILTRRTLSPWPHFRLREGGAASFTNTCVLPRNRSTEQSLVSKPSRI